MSPDLAALEDAVLTAQRNMDWHAESVAVPALVDVLSPLPRVNGRSTEAIRRRFWSKVVWGMSDCWYWRGSLNNNGYGEFPIRKKLHRVHRLSWEMHRGPVPRGMQVLHRCDVRNCINPDHLFLGTQADNIADMMAKGRGYSPMQPGMGNPMRKLDASDVLSIRAEFAEGRATVRELAKRYGVHTSTIYLITARISWTNI